MADEFMSNAANHNTPKVTVIPSEAKDLAYNGSWYGGQERDLAPCERFLAPLRMTRET